MFRLPVLSLLLTAVGGCAVVPSRPDPQTNALIVPASRFDTMWERAVSVLHRHHFQIARESRLEGTIETEYRDGSGLLEPWHPDSVGLDSRLESGIQSIRRKVTVTFSQSGTDQVLIAVFVHKQIEDVPGPTATYAGGATFSESSLLERDLDQVTGQAVPSRWLPAGRDRRLEARLVAQIQYGDR